jgi:hypothetical protein
MAEAELPEDWREMMVGKNLAGLLNWQPGERPGT